MSQQRFVQEVQRLCTRQESGSLIAQSAGGTLATLTVQNGEIIALGFRTLKGREALEKFRTLGESKVSFRPGMLRDPQPDLPDTDEMILLLGGDLAAGNALITTSGQAISQQELQTLIEQEVATLMGPSARLFCAEYFDQQPALFDADGIRQAVVKIAGSAVGTSTADTLADNVISKIGL